MSSATIQQQAQTPIEELQERLVEVVPGIHAAALAVGLEDHRRMLADHARRVREDYNRLAKAAGEPVANQGDPEMGNITITGDINVADARQVGKVLGGLANGNGTGATQPTAPAPTSQPPVQQPTTAQPTTTPAPEEKSLWSKTWPWLLAAGVGLGGVGVTYAVTRPTTTIVNPPVDVPKYNVEKWIPPKTE